MNQTTMSVACVMLLVSLLSAGPPLPPDISSGDEVMDPKLAAGSALPTAPEFDEAISRSMTLLNVHLVVAEPDARPLTTLNHYIQFDPMFSRSATTVNPFFPYDDAYSRALTARNTDCLADVNFDGVVNPTDLALLLGRWGPCDDVICGFCDLQPDGTVGPSDLAILLGTWGPCEG